MSTPLQAASATRQEHISRVVKNIFSDLKDEMDTIVSTADLDSIQQELAWLEQQTAAAAAAAATAPPTSSTSTVAQAMLQLHGRTQSESPGYYDYVLPNPLSKLPDEPGLEGPSTAVQHAPAGHQLDGPTEAMQPSAAEQGMNNLDTGQATVAGSAAAEDAVSSAQAASASTAAAPTHARWQLTTDEITDAGVESTVDEASSVRAQAHDHHPGTCLEAALHASLSSSAGAQAQEEPMQLDMPAAEALTRLQQQLEVQQAQQPMHRSTEELLSSPAALAAFNEQCADAADARELYSQQNRQAAATLSYRELLDRALAWNPRYRGTGSSAGSSMRASADMQRYSSAGASTSSSTTSSRRQRPRSTGGPAGRAGPSAKPDYKAKLQQLQHSSARHAMSKFPGAGFKSSHFSFAEQGTSSAGTAGWMLKDASTPGQQPAALRRKDAAMQEISPPRPKTLYRSRSAPREEAAARRHVERMNASPTRAAATQRDSILSQQHLHHLQHQHQQLYRQWKQQEHSRQPANSKDLSVRSHEAQLPMHLNDEEWTGVSTCFHQDEAGRQERMQLQQDKQRPAGAQGFTQRARSTSPGPVPVPLPADFVRRQNALLQKRAELAAKKRPSDEEDMTECTFHPQINPASRSLQRSVEQLHAWDARRKLTVFAKALDKCEMECEGYTFAPTINPLSRQLALANYAVSPDPARPWTTSPTATRPQVVSPRPSCPSPEAVRMLRDALPPANVIMRAGPTAQQKAESVMHMLGVPLPAGPVSSIRLQSSSPAPSDMSGRRSPTSSSKLNSIEELQEQQLLLQEAKLAVATSAVVLKASENHPAGHATVAANSHSPRAADLALEGPSNTVLQRLAPGVVLGVPIKMPALGVPADVTGPAAVAKPASSSFSLHTVHGPPSGMSDQIQVVTVTADSPLNVSGLQQFEGSRAISAADGVTVTEKQPGTGQDDHATAAAATAQPLSNFTAAPPANAAGGADASTKHHKELLEPQMLLAALKLTPAQAQHGLEEGKAQGSDSSAPQAAARGSSSGGMAPGTPVLGSLGGCGTSSNDACAPSCAKPLRVARDDSAGGMYSAALAKKLSIGGGGGVLNNGSANGHKSASSPLSRCQQQGEPAANNAGDAAALGLQGLTLEDLAQKLGIADKAAAQQLRLAGLQTVPAFFYSTAEVKSPGVAPPAAAADTRRPGSSYSQKYQKRLARLSGDASTSPLPPGLAALLHSLAGAEGGNVAAALAALADASCGGEPLLSPNFEQLKAAWIAKDIAAREASGPGTKSGSGGVLSGPGTPMHSHGVHPFAVSSDLSKQYSTAQMLNAQARHSLTGDINSTSCGASLDAGPEAASQQLGLPADDGKNSSAVADPAAAAAAAGSAGAVAPGVQVLLVPSDHATAGAPGDRSSSNAGTCCSPKTAQALGACSSVLSLPDAAAVGTAVMSAESCNGSPQTQIVEKVEVLLEGTQSVPFELVLSPRTKFLIASSCPAATSGSGGPTSVVVNTPLGQRLLQLVLSGRQAQGGDGVGSNGDKEAGGVPSLVTLPLAQWQQLLQQHACSQQQQQEHCEPVAHAGGEAEAAVAGGHNVVPGTAAVGLPVVQSSNSAVDAVTQALTGAADRAGPAVASCPSSPAASTGSAATHVPTVLSPLVPGSTAASPLGLCVNEQLVLSMLRPALASPHLVDSSASTPTWGTPTPSYHSLSVPQQQQQQQQQQHDASAGTGNAGGSEGGSSSSGGGAAAFGSFVVPASKALPAGAAAGPYTQGPVAEAVTAYASAGPEQPRLVTHPQLQQPQQQLQWQEPQQARVLDGGDVELAAELAALLQSAGSLSPEEKADRVARTFAKTISRLNMSSDVLQQTIAVLDPTASAAPSAEEAAAAADPPAAAVLPSAGGCPQAETTGTAGPIAAAGRLGICDLPEADNMQQLLERVSQGMILPAQTPASFGMQQQQQLNLQRTAEVQQRPAAAGAYGSTHGSTLSNAWLPGGVLAHTSQATAAGAASPAPDAGDLQPGTATSPAAAAAAAAAQPPAGSTSSMSWAAVVAAKDSKASP